MADVNDLIETTHVSDPSTGPVRPDAVASEPARRPSWQRRPSRWASQVAGLTLALVALGVASGLLYRYDRSMDSSARQQAAVSAARTVALQLSTIGADNAAEHVAELGRLSTGEFHDQINGYSAIFQKILKVGDVSSQGAVTAAGIERRDAETATVLVTVSSTVRNSQIPSGQPRNYRLSVVLLRSGDQWLASKVDYVG